MGKSDKNQKSINNHATEMFAMLDHETKNALLTAFEKASSFDNLISNIMIGPCPSCGSTNTIDGEEPPINDNTVGICLSCGSLWCLECNRRLEADKLPCSCWYEDSE